jgi:hypothetical protein
LRAALERIGDKSAIEVVALGNRLIDFCKRHDGRAPGPKGFSFMIRALLANQRSSTDQSRFGQRSIRGLC